MLTEDQKQKLNADIPKSVLKSRDQAGRSFSYVDGFYVIDRLNDIFGPGGWSYRCELSRAVEPYVVKDKYNKDQWRVTYLSVCTLTVGDCVITDIGAGHGADKDVGQAIESATKEAATDSLKRCAKSLGRSMGLALYDKAQEFVTDDTTPPVPSAKERAEARRKETDEQKAHRQAGHDATWEHDKPDFMRRLCGPAVEGGLEFPYDQFCEMLEIRAQAAGFPYVPPSNRPKKDREKLLEWAGSDAGGEARAAYLSRREAA